MRVLVVAAHPDDELLGQGGTVAKHASNGDACTIAIAADHGSARYDEETISKVRQCTVDAAKHLGVSDVRFGGMPDQALDTLPILEITQWVESVADGVRPELVYIHHRGDINRDHQIVCEASLTAFRPYSTPYAKKILSFETPSATEWAGPFVETAFVPNVFVDISDHIDAKLKAVSAYETELRPFPHPRSVEALRTRAAHWGSVIGVSAAEPFTLVRELG